MAQKTNLFIVKDILLDFHLNLISFLKTRLLEPPLVTRWKICDR